MVTCPKCEHSFVCTEHTAKVGKIVQDCPIKKGAIWAQVQHDGRREIPGVYVRVSGVIKPVVTDDVGYAPFDPLDPGPYEVSIVPLEGRLAELYEQPSKHPRKVEVKAGKIASPLFELKRRPKMRLSRIAPFDRVTVGKSQGQPQRLRIENVGAAPLIVGPFEVDNPEFRPHEDLLVQRMVEPGELWDLLLPFSPLVRGERRAALRFTSNDPDDRGNDLALQGVGLQPRIEIVPAPFTDVLLSFGAAGLFTTANVTVYNRGDEGSILEVTDIELRGGQNALFTPPIDKRLTVEKDAPKTFQLTFTPLVRGSFGSNVHVKSNDPNQEWLGSAVAARCVGPLLRVTPRLDFATVPLGTAPPTLDVTIYNDGDAPFDVTGTTINGGGGLFSITRALRPGPILGGLSASLTITAGAPGTTAPPAGVLDVTTGNAGNEAVPLEASAYALTSATANVPTISAGVDDADVRYVVDDPKGVVGKATVTIHEINHTTNAIGKVIGTVAGQTFANGNNTFSWRGAVNDVGYRVRDDAQPFITKRNAPYRVRVTIARPDDSGPLDRTCDVDVANTGELTVQVHREDGAALATQAAFTVTPAAGGLAVPHVTVAKGGALPTCDEIVIKGLAPGNYDVQITGTAMNAAAGLAAYLVAQGGGGGWRIGPSQTGVARVAIKVAERATASFQITRYTQVQFVGFHATPTGTNRSLLTPLVTATYLGEADDRQDMIARCQITKAAMAAAEADHVNIPVDHTTLKVFMAPEFFFRGQGGGYPNDIVEEILPKLIGEASQAIYEDWLFVYGTAIGYFKHGDGVPERYTLAISQDLGGVPQTVRVTAGAGPGASKADVCDRVPANRPAPVQWALDQGGTIAPIQTTTRVSATDFDVLLAAGAPALAVNPVTLVEPLATEIFNVALVQRGGPNPGGTRDLLVYKDYLSSIDFLGRHHPDVLDDFYGDHPTHLADIHGTPERYIMPTEGAVDAFGTRPNPAVAGGTSEQNRLALGGGALFSMAGINFGVEVCLDHLEERLNTYGANATPGDTLPQVHLIPSWGMTIGEGPIYAVPNGLVFNVDGRVGAPPEAGTFTGFHCPDIPHNGVVVAAPRPAACASPHARCRRHVHLQAAGGACGSCGGATAPSGFLCTAAHNWMTAADCLCTILHQQVKVCTLHNTAVPGRARRSAARTHSCRLTVAGIPRTGRTRTPFAQGAAGSAGWPRSSFSRAAPTGTRSQRPPVRRVAPGRRPPRPMRA